MSNKNQKLIQVEPEFYKTKQQEPVHNLVANLDKNSLFEPGTCVLDDGEAAIIVAHADGPYMYSEDLRAGLS